MQAVKNRPELNMQSNDTSPEEGRTPKRSKMIYKEKQFQEDKKTGKSLVQDQRAQALRSKGKEEVKMSSPRGAINDSDEGEPQNQTGVREGEKLLESMLNQYKEQKPNRY